MMSNRASWCPFRKWQRFPITQTYSSRADSCASGLVAACWECALEFGHFISANCYFWRQMREDWDRGRGGNPGARHMRVLPLLDRTESSVGILPVLLRGNELYALEKAYRQGCLCYPLS